jgi:hypothetical protein
MKTEHMNLKDHILDEASRRLGEHIDRMVLAGSGLVFEFHLEYSTGKVFGKEYLTVAPMNAEGLWSDMMSWMVTTFGPSGTTENPGCWTADQRWYANNAKFWFRNQKDRDWFVLRWNS